MLHSTQFLGILAARNYISLRDIAHCFVEFSRPLLSSLHKHPHKCSAVLFLLMG